MTVPQEKYTNERLSGDKKAPTHGEGAVSGRDALHPPSLYEKTENHGEEQKTERGIRQGQFALSPFCCQGHIKR